MNGRGRGTVTRLSGRAAVALTVANGNTSAALMFSPNSITRLSNVQKAFEFYRFKKLAFRIPPFTRMETSVPDTSSAQLYAIGWYPDETASTGTSVSVTSVLSLQCALTSSCNLAMEAAGVPTVGVPGETRERVLRVKPSVLTSTPTRWWRTQGTTTSEDVELYQGTLIVALADSAGANTVVVPTVVEYVVEFTGEADATSLTMELARTPKIIDPYGVDSDDGLLVGKAQTERKAATRDIAVKGNPRASK